MKCPLCGYEFTEEQARTACSSCPLSQGCNMVCCPNCGYEIPVEPGWLKRIKAWRKHGAK